MNDSVDQDTISSEEISSQFQSWSLSDEEAVSLNTNYILRICAAGSNKLGFLSSDSTCYIYSYDNTKLRYIQKYHEENVKVSDIKISPLNDNILYTSSADGCIRLFDERSGNNCVTVYQENPETKEFTKPISSFDVSCNDRVLCGGTEATEGDAFMLFWDIRKTELLGAYWNSHTDDIVQVQFSKNKRDQLITAGVDGLVNIFDISELSEDDALRYSLNAECAVDRLCWVSDEVVACITDNVEVQIWNIETADQMGLFSRKSIAKTMKRKVVADCYVIDVFKSNNSTSILAGSYSDFGKCLRSVEINLEKKKLTPYSNFEGNKQLIRCSAYDSQNDILITGGESGIVSLWKKQSSVTRKSKISTATEKLKIHKEKPY